MNLQEKWPSALWTGPLPALFSRLKVFESGGLICIWHVLIYRLEFQLSFFLSRLPASTFSSSSFQLILTPSLSSWIATLKPQELVRKMGVGGGGGYRCLLAPAVPSVDFLGALFPWCPNCGQGRLPVSCLAAEILFSVSRRDSEISRG